jgi:hypothetical protein
VKVRRSPLKKKELSCPSCDIFIRLELIKHATVEDVAIVPKKDDDRNDLLDDNGLKVMELLLQPKVLQSRILRCPSFAISVRKLASKASVARTRAFSVICLLTPSRWTALTDFGDNHGFVDGKPRPQKRHEEFKMFQLHGAHSTKQSATQFPASVIQSKKSGHEERKVVSKRIKPGFFMSMFVFTCRGRTWAKHSVNDFKFPCEWIIALLSGERGCPLPRSVTIPPHLTPCLAPFRSEVSPNHRLVCPPKRGK